MFNLLTNFILLVINHSCLSSFVLLKQNLSDQEAHTQRKFISWCSGGQAAQDQGARNLLSASGIGLLVCTSCYILYLSFSWTPLASVVRILFTVIRIILCVLF